MLGDGVDRGQRRPLPLRRGHGDERAAAIVERVPGRLGAGARLAHRVLDQRAVGGAVEPLAVDAHGGGDHHALHRPVDQLLEQDRGAAVVDGDVAVHGVHALADADLGGEVDHLVHAGEGAAHQRFVAHVADHQFHVGIELVRPAAPAMDLLDQAVEDAHVVAFGEQGAGDVAADEAGAAGDQYCVSQTLRSSGPSVVHPFVRADSRGSRIPQGNAAAGQRGAALRVARALLAFL